MPIVFVCIKCGKNYTVDRSLAGKTAKCKACSATMKIPKPERKPSAVKPWDNLSGLRKRAVAGDDLRDDQAYGSVTRRPRSNSSAGVPPWVWFAGAGVCLLSTILIAATIFSRPGVPEVAQVDEPQAEGAQVEGVQADPPKEVVEAPVVPPPATANKVAGDIFAQLRRESSRAAGATTFEWLVKPDPLPETIEFPPVEKLAIRIPESVPRYSVLYPTTPSAFVLVGGNEHSDRYREVWDLRTAKRVGRLSGDIPSVIMPMAFSPDGAYFLHHVVTIPGATDVYSIAENRRIARIDDDKGSISDVADFAGPGRVIIGTSYKNTLQVWDFLNRTPTAKITTPAIFDARSLAFSPGRRYVALTLLGQDRLLVYDLTTGNQVGDLTIEQTSGIRYTCRGLAFSPDGTALAGLFTLGDTTHLICWDATNGKSVSDFVSPGRDPYGHSYAYDVRPIQWFPDQSGWLIEDQAFVERRSGRVVWSIPFTIGNIHEHGPRKVLDLGRIVVVVGVGGSPAIRLLTLPKEKIEAAMASARASVTAVEK